MKKILGLTLGLVLLSSTAYAWGGKNIAEDKPFSANIERHFSGDRKARPEISAEKKAEFQKRMAEHKESFAKRLKLTEEQQKKSEELRKAQREEMKKIMEEMKALQAKSKELREQNKKDFEALLTPEQKQILEEMDKERKTKQAERMAKMKQDRKGKARPDVKDKK